MSRDVYRWFSEPGWVRVLVWRVQQYTGPPTTSTSLHWWRRWWRQWKKSISIS